jgi:hypothetical protein
MGDSSLTDRQIEAVLLAAGTYKQIARAHGLKPRVVQYIRARQSRRALRIAHRLGLDRHTTRSCYSTDGAVVVRPLDEVAARITHPLYAR